MCRDFGARETELDLSSNGPENNLTVGKLAHRLGIVLADSEGSRLVIVNGILIPSEKVAELILHDCDHVEFHMMLSGG